MLVLSKYKVMKNTLYNLLTFLMLSASIVSCTDDDYSRQACNESEERTIKIKLSLKSDAPKTRALENILEDEDENAIKSLQLFIFRRGGEQLLVKDYYFSQWHNQQIIDAYTGRFRYVLVANLHEEWTGITKYSDLADKLYTISNESDISRNNSDKSLAAVFNKELLIPYPAPGTDIVELKDGTQPIALTRLSSKVILNIKIDGVTPNNTPLKDKLNVKSVQMKNASKAMYIFNENAELDKNTTDSIHYPLRTYSIGDKNDKDDAFYILERKAKEYMTLGTYVEIKAEYRDTDSDVPTKLVTYRAAFNTEPFQQNNYTGDFNVSRNKLYQLNVTLVGTNDQDIRVEVEELQRNGVYVNTGATGRGTGANWEDAFATISDAIKFINTYNSAHTPLTYIYVKEGTYNENIVVPNGVNIAGGFAHTLSGTDLTHDGKIKPVLKPSATSRQIPIVKFENNLTTKTTLSYFIIEDGNADKGAGVYMESDSAAIHACRIRNNSANQGAGLYMTGGQVWNCIIDNNTAISNGAGIYIAGNAQNVCIQNATIVDNKWGSTPPPSPDGIIVNQPACGIYAASGAKAGVYGSILYGNGNTNNVPSGTSYEFCAFATETPLAWEEIANANIGIYPTGTNINQPYVNPVNTPGFTNDGSYALSTNSPLLSRSYVGREQAPWSYPDYNGSYPTNRTFPDLGAIQSTEFKEYIDVYLRSRSFLPFMEATTDCFIASNITPNNFTSSTLDWAVRPSDRDYYKTLKLKTLFSNTSMKIETLQGKFINASHPLTIQLDQAYINFEAFGNTGNLNINRDLYIMPTSEAVSYDLFTQIPLKYTVKTSINKDDITYLSLDNDRCKWLDASEQNGQICYSNASYIPSVNQQDTRSVEQSLIGFNYQFKTFDTDIERTIYPFENNRITQVPEWSLGDGSSTRVLGLKETDYNNYFQEKSFLTWQFNVPTLTETSVYDGKTNTAKAINQIRQATDYKWDTSNEEAYKYTQRNAFIFCASLDPKIREKLMSNENQDISPQELTWYIPSLNELKYITVFGNGALEFYKEVHYISSTFSGNYLRRFNPTNYLEWKAQSGEPLREGFLRCIRSSSTGVGSELLSGVAVIDSLNTYLIRSEGMHSNHIISSKDIIPVPGYNDMAVVFQIYGADAPSESSSFSEALEYCQNLSSEGGHGNWRLPTQKEMMLMHLYKDKCTQTASFEPLSGQDYFISQSKLGSLKKVFDFTQGCINSYDDVVSRVRCVRSIKQVVK